MTINNVKNRATKFFSWHGFSYNFSAVSHSKDMERIRIFNGEGKTKDERETCFPNFAKQDTKNKGGKRVDG